MQTTEKRTTEEIYLEIARNEHDRAMQGKSNQAKRDTWRALCAAMDAAQRASGHEVNRPLASEPNQPYADDPDHGGAPRSD